MSDTQFTVAIRPRDPVIARDGRPFGIDSGRRMRSLDWPHPSVVTGTIRTILGKSLGGDFCDAAFRDKLKRVRVSGPLPSSEGQVFLPAADDLVLMKDGIHHAARPVSDGAGWGGADLPQERLRPVCLPPGVEGKRAYGVPAWWSRERMGAWLLADRAAPPDFLADRSRFRESPGRDERSHVSIDPDSFAAEEGLLFSTSGLVLDRLIGGVGPPAKAATAGDATGCRAPAEASRSHENELIVRVGVPAESADLAVVLANLDAWHSIGGERRIAHFRVAEGPPYADAWDGPRGLEGALGAIGGGPDAGVRMVLASPALFDGGWRPGWVRWDEEEGWLARPPATPGVTLKLVGLANRRWRAVSGWSYETGKPKAARRLVPAGAVYFFERVEGDLGGLASAWLRPVSDRPEDRDDGFGLAAWGPWHGAKGS